MSKKEKKSRCSYDLSMPLSFNEILQKKFPKYYSWLPDSEGKYEKCYETTSFIDLLGYAYGVGQFRLSSDNGFLFEFNPDNYSAKDCKRCGFLEPFDFVTHNLLTAYELDIWIKYLREEDIY